MIGKYNDIIMHHITGGQIYQLHCLCIFLFFFFLYLLLS